MTRPMVLVVDDDPSVLSFVAQIVAGAKYNVVTASSGLEALEIAVERHVDLLITDSQMPGIGGSELITRIKASGAIKRFLMISGWTQAEGEGIRFLTKPFRPDQLLRKIEDVMVKPEVRAFARPA